MIGSIRIVTLVLVSALGSAVAQTQPPSPPVRPRVTPVTNERLRSPEPENWLMYRGNYASWGYSPLEQIDVDNVGDLVPVWTFSTGAGEGHESPPIVNDGMMYITTPPGGVLALDARSGDLVWRYERELPEELTAMHPTNRGVGLFGDKVYVATPDAFVVALDAQTGEPIWETAIVDYRQGYYMTMAPLVASGNVMVGVSGGEMGIRGFVQALDASTGEPAWKTYTIPGPGESGHDSWPGDTWKTGGAPVWVTGSVDPQLNLSFWGTGNAAPWMGDARPGDNLYASSVVALDIDTGKLVAFHQYHWNDSWDWDEVSAPMLIDVSRDGRQISSLVHPGRNGYLWLLERASDEISFVDAWPFVLQDVFTSIDPVTGRPEVDPNRKPGTDKRASFCPSFWGGKNWPPAAYSPRTRLVYVPANENLCSTMEGRSVSYSSGQRYTGIKIISNRGISIREGADHIGELQAWNLDTGEKAWSHDFQSHIWGPILTTGGDLVFVGGTNDRYFRAFDARTGKLLWQQRTNSGITGVPSSFAVDGIQYVAVQSGWGIDARKMQSSIDGIVGRESHVPEGGVLWVFALKQ